MAYARSDGARLWYDETGSGYPIVFVHEFGGDLLMLPGTGHAVNLEEPAAFNDAVARFLASVERGSWRARDPRAAPGGPVLPIGAQD